MPRRSRRLPDPEAVLTGRARVSMEELVALVHRVNPTGRQLPADEEAHRYRQKSELQSLLIARHGDDLVVEQVSEDVVSLRHPHGMADACHAVVGELDEEARAWVRRRLVDATLAEPHEPDRPTAPLDRTVSLDPLARGRVALEEWDYDQARACLHAT